MAVYHDVFYIQKVIEPSARPDITESTTRYQTWTAKAEKELELLKERQMGLIAPGACQANIILLRSFDNLRSLFAKIGKFRTLWLEMAVY